MSSIIDETLTLARQGKTVGETTLVSLSDVAAESCDNVAIDRDRVSVEPAHSEFYADPSKLFHIFENLYRNSLEHGGDDVTISVGPVDGGFYVEDDGDGVPDEKKGEIFDVGVTEIQGESSVLQSGDESDRSLH
jgi:signal transduction histidine kinase